MSLKLVAAVMLALPLAFVPSAVAQDLYDVGASGQCYDDTPASEPEGGEAYLRVSQSGGVQNGMDPTGSHGIVAALSKFALGTVEDGGQAGSACDRYDCIDPQSVCEENGQDQRYDYLEVHATVANVNLQVCYRGPSAGGPVVVTDSSNPGCHRAPAGPGQGG